MLYIQMYIIIIPRKMASNQALPGPSTSGFSSPSESPWEVQQKEKVINYNVRIIIGSIQYLIGSSVYA